MSTVLLALGLLQTSPEELRAQVELLKSDDIAVREEAQKKLVAGGLKALEWLLELKSADPEVDAVVGAIVDSRLRADRARRLSAPVTLELKDATIARAVEALRKQAPFRIELDLENVPDDLTIDEIRLTKVPFGRALQEILEKADLRVAGEDPERLRLFRPPHLTFTFRQADLRVILDMTLRVAGVEVRAEEGVGGRVDVVCENKPWTAMIDGVAADRGAAALRSGKGILLRPRAAFEKELKTRVFPLRHLKLEDPPGEGPGRLERLARALDARLTRGAGWETVHGKLEYDPRRKALVVTDRAEILAEAEKMIAEADRP